MPVRIYGRLVPFTGRPMQLMTIGALAMENRSLIAAAQQSFADTASALFTIIQHNAPLSYKSDVT